MGEEKKDSLVHNHPASEIFPKYWQPRCHQMSSCTLSLSRYDMFRKHEIKHMHFKLLCFLYLHLSEFSVPTYVSLIARNLLFIAMNLIFIVILLHGSWCCNYEDHTNTVWLRLEPLEESSNILLWTFSLRLEEQIGSTCFSCLLTFLLAVFVGTKETSDERQRCRVLLLLWRLCWF